MIKHFDLWLIGLVLIVATSSANIQVVYPPELAKQFPSGISIHVSPIGFRPLSGNLYGKVMLANPAGACSMIQDVHSQNQDIFILADDSECLQSIKAKNIAASGGYIAIIKQNIFNTLHDKQINLVHIPVVEVKPAEFDQLLAFISDNQQTVVSLNVDFTDNTQTHPINLQVWFSPTELDSYTFILAMQDFISGQSDRLSFSPHYVLQSQRESKNYIGCLSSGRYCPTEIQFEGKYEGKGIVEETLRQVVIWKLSSQQWWKYIKEFHKNCLQKTANIFENTTKLQACSTNAMILSGIDQSQFQKQYDSSFLGNKKQVDDNTYLLQERQLYVSQQITSHPVGLINKKPIALELSAIQQKVCKMQGNSPSDPCKASHNLSNSQILIVILVMGVLFIGIAALYRLYMHIRMRNQIKSEVDKTLEQYYRYIQTFEGQNGAIGSVKQSKKEKSRPLTEELDEYKQDNKEKINEEVEMRDLQK